MCVLHCGIRSLCTKESVHVTDQCRRRACRKADRPSMMSRMATVRVANAEKMIDRPKKPPPLREERPRCITMDQSTSDSSAERKHKVPLTCMGEAEGPKAQVGGRVRYASQTVLYGVDGLVDGHIAKVKLHRTN
ncbi:hypothetical protein GOODEAATRI_032711 [Goodea atripinnis]|uniref:Uncharacterized protein n=1 Tax=Goodea atripinnis TaxID=208336 RepID=A0ABV0MX12_9TELE